jgi:hypothetical protein
MLQVPEERIVKKEARNSSALKMEEARSSEIMATFRRNRHILEDRTLHNHCRQNPRSNKEGFVSSSEELPSKSLHH